MTGTLTYGCAVCRTRYGDARAVSVTTASKPRKRIDYREASSHWMSTGAAH